MRKNKLSTTLKLTRVIIGKTAFNELNPNYNY
jgi:hypothetical protein